MVKLRITILLLIIICAQNYVFKLRVTIPLLIIICEQNYVFKLRVTIPLLIIICEQNYMVKLRVTTPILIIICEENYVFKLRLLGLGTDFVPKKFRGIDSEWFPLFRGRKYPFRGIPSSAEEPIPKLGTERNETGFREK
jgi:hypothetical protein